MFNANLIENPNIPLTHLYTTVFALLLDQIFQVAPGTKCLADCYFNMIIYYTVRAPKHLNTEKNVVVQYCM